MDVILAILISGLVTAIVCNIGFYFRSEPGTFEVKLDEEDGIWNGKLNFNPTIDFDKKKKLIIKIIRK